MGTFFEATGRHDGQIDCTAKVDKVGVGLVLDLHVLLLGLFFIVTAADVGIVVVIVIVVATVRLAENLSLELTVSALVCLPVRVKLEDVQTILDINLIIQARVVGDLVLLFDQIQVLLDGGVVLVTIFPDLEQDFDHVLHALVDIGLVQDAAELVEHSKGNLSVELLNVLADLLHQTDGNLDAVVGGLVEQQEQHLGGEHLVSDLVVDQVSEKGSAAETDGLVVSLVCLAELHNQAVDEQLADLGQLGVDNGGHGGVDGGEGQTGSLGLHDAPAKQTAASDQVLGEELGDNVLDVGDVDFVDEAVDGLFERLPSHALIFL